MKPGEIQLKLCCVGCGKEREFDIHTLSLNSSLWKRIASFGWHVCWRGGPGHTGEACCSPKCVPVIVEPTK